MNGKHMSVHSSAAGTKDTLDAPTAAAIGSIGE